jgi:hypothetical protein
MSITYDKAKLGSKAALYCELNHSRLTQELEYRAEIFLADVNPGNIKFA